jgi:hypothetical protein
VFWFSLQLLCETFFILRRIQRDLVMNAQKTSGKVAVILVRVWSKLNFLDRFSKSTRKPGQWEPSYYMQADGQTGMTELKPGTPYPHVTWAHIKLPFYFQLLPYPFPCVGSHMLISIVWWLGVI